VGEVGGRVAQGGRAETTPQSCAVIGESFSNRHNSLNFLRLVLATSVLISHAIVLGGFGTGAIKTTNAGTVAVYGFFGISGYLVAGSADRNTLGRYLWMRVLRIFPGFWVSLTVTAFLFAFVAWNHLGQSLRPGCGLPCFVHTSGGPVQYLYRNALLKMNQQQISGTPPASPFGWNGSLWTLYYEFLCYLLVGAFGVIGLLRRRHLVLVLTGVVLLTELVAGITLGRDLGFFEGKMLTFSAVFLVGALLYLYREKVPDSGLLAIGCSTAFVASLWLPLLGHGPIDRSLPFRGQLSGSSLLAPMLTYPLLWLGIHLPFQEIGVRNDYSYGIYIYAYPVQQLLAIWGVERWGFLAYMLLGIVGTLPFAVASWRIIEKPALELKRISLHSSLTLQRRE
jgi:peptidoglycan/LPS O-acetylase OafA/YrhL